MREKYKPNTDERPSMIILGIIIFYALICIFFVYLYLLHRISLTVCLVVVVALSLIYIPRFMIIRKLYKKDEIKIYDNSICINGFEIDFQRIKDYKIEEKKPVVLFVINNNLVVYNEAKFYLRFDNGQTSFVAIGSEKIRLLKEFLDEIISK